MNWFRSLPSLYWFGFGNVVEAASDLGDDLIATDVEIDPILLLFILRSVQPLNMEAAKVIIPHMQIWIMQIGWNCLERRVVIGASESKVTLSDAAQMEQDRQSHLIPLSRSNLWITRTAWLTHLKRFNVYRSVWWCEGNNSFVINCCRVIRAPLAGNSCFSHDWWSDHLNVSSEC